MNVLRQHNVKRIGAFIHVLYLTMPLFSILAYSASLITMYTVLLPWVKPVAPWLTIQLFIAVVLVACLIVLFLFYKFVYPSYMSFQNRQEYSHNSLLAKDLAEIKKRLGIGQDKT